MSVRKIFARARDAAAIVLCAAAFVFPHGAMAQNTSKLTVPLTVQPPGPYAYGTAIPINVLYYPPVTGFVPGIAWDPLQFADNTINIGSAPLSFIGAGYPMALNGSFNCVLLNDGDVNCWGNNGIGQLGDGTTTPQPFAGVGLVNLGVGNKARAVSVGQNFSCATLFNGGVKCWGSGFNGELGNGIIGSSPTPVDVIDLGGPVQMTASGNLSTCALLVSGGVKCWGLNAAGIIGNGETTGLVYASPIDPIGLQSGVAMLAAGGPRMCAVTNAGALLCWGFNANGGLGTGDSDPHPAPATVIPSGVVSVALSDINGCALMDTGTVKCWGNNSVGQIGVGSTTPVSFATPTDVPGLTGVVSIALASGTTCALLDNGGMKCWGASPGLGTGAPAQLSPINYVKGLSSGVRAISGSPLQPMLCASLNSTTVIIGGNSIEQGSSAIKCWGLNSTLGNGMFSADEPQLSIAFGAILIGKTSFTPPTLNAGPHSIVASYPAGATNAPPSQSDPLAFTITQLTSTTTLGSTPNPSAVNHQVTFTATVTTGATGTVAFNEGMTTLATAPVSGGVATFTTSTLTVGSHTITAAYSGDVNFSASVSNAVVQVVTQPTTSTALTTDVNPSAYGGAVTFTATVTASGTPTGNVVFSDGATVLGSVALSGGTASLTTAALLPGSHTIGATYTGSPAFSPSGISITQTVNKGASTTALSGAPPTANFGQTITFTATVGAVAPAPGTPSGSVTFNDTTTGTTIGTQPLSSGVANLSTNALTAGSHNVIAIYNGDNAFLVSISPTASVTVSATGVALALTSSHNPSAVGEPVTLTATATSPSGTPTGNVTIKDGGNPIGSVALSGGTGSLTTSALAAGAHSLIASYEGNGVFPAATAPALMQTVILSCTDKFADATQLSGATGSASGFNTTATGESGESNHAGTSGTLNSVWCTWTAPANGAVTFDTTGSDFDTTLAVYTGGAVNGLTPIASNDNATGLGGLSRVAFTATQGVPYRIAIDGAGSSTGHYVLNWSQPVTGATLLASVLPTSRSVVTGQVATAFATMIDSGKAVTGCTLSLPPGFPAGFFYQATDAGNVPTGTINAPVDIAAGGAQGFIFGVTPTVDLNAAEIAVVFACLNAAPALTVPGLNTLSLSAASVPTPDILMIGATPSNDGIVKATVGSISFFTAAAVNIGAAGTLTAAVDDNGKNLPLTITLCQTNSATGACMNPASPGTSSAVSLATNDIATFAIFIKPTAAVALDPANTRLFLRLKTADGVTRGATSIAVTAANPPPPPPPPPTCPPFTRCP